MTDPYNIVKNTSGKASVWKFFGFVKESGTLDKKRVGCLLCRNILKYSGNTTNLTDHMRRRHAAAFTKRNQRPDASMMARKLIYEPYKFKLYKFQDFMPTSVVFLFRNNYCNSIAIVTSNSNSITIVLSAIALQ